jgi:hypothetical protein
MLKKLVQMMFLGSLLIVRQFGSRQQLILHMQSTGIDELSLRVSQYKVLLVIGYTPVLIMLRDGKMGRLQHTFT